MDEVSFYFAKFNSDKSSHKIIAKLQNIQYFRFIRRYTILSSERVPPPLKVGGEFRRGVSLVGFEYIV